MTRYIRFATPFLCVLIACALVLAQMGASYHAAQHPQHSISYTDNTAHAHHDHHDHHEDETRPPHCIDCTLTQALHTAIFATDAPHIPIRASSYIIRFMRTDSTRPILAAHYKSRAPPASLI